MQSCSPYQELSNGMLHITCTQGNCGDSRLLVDESQIANLTPAPFFGHNLRSNVPMGLLWAGYKQVENYKTRQVLLIHQLVLIC